MQILKCPPGHLTIFKSFLNSYFGILPEKISIVCNVINLPPIHCKRAKIRNILCWLTAGSRCCKRNVCTCLLYLDKGETEALLAQFCQKQENKWNESYCIGLSEHQVISHLSTRWHLFLNNSCADPLSQL